MPLHPLPSHLGARGEKEEWDQDSLLKGAGSVAESGTTMLMVAAAGKTLEHSGGGGAFVLFSRCRQQSPQPLFNSVLAAGPFWGLSTHGEFPFRFSLPPTQLVISPGLPPTLLFPPSAFDGVAWFGPPHCHQRVLLLLLLPPCLHRTRVPLPCTTYCGRTEEEELGFLFLSFRCFLL